MHQPAQPLPVFVCSAALPAASSALARLLTPPAVPCRAACYAQGAYERARAILTQHQDKLHTLAQQLLDKETLSGDEIIALTGGWAWGGFDQAAQVSSVWPALGGVVGSRGAR